MRNTLATGLIVLAGVALAADLRGQTVSNVVVPANFTTLEGPNGGFWAISPFAARRQLLIDESHLRGLRGKRIRSIWLRRNAGDRSAFAAGTVGLEVSISHARTKANGAERNFARNRGTNVQVAFTGLVKLPASSVPTNAPSPWSVEIRLQKPFLYGGGTLCIETVTTPVNSPVSREPAWWPIDAITNSGGGMVAKFGGSCIAGMGRQPAGADEAGLTPGSTASLYLRGRTSATSALCFLGTSSKFWGTTSLPMDLRRFGAGGCHVYVELLVPVSIPLVKLSSHGLSYGSWTVQLPNSTSIVGMSLYSQWVVNARTPFGLATSNGVRAIVGASSPLTGVAWIESPGTKKAIGSVLRGRAPVLRFTAQ